MPGAEAAAQPEQHLSARPDGGDPRGRDVVGVVGDEHVVVAAGLAVLGAVAEHQIWGQPWRGGGAERSEPGTPSTALAGVLKAVTNRSRGRSRRASRQAGSVSTPLVINRVMAASR